MQRLALLSIATSLAAGLAAQSNTVPGLDGRLTVIDDMTYYGRRGPAHPNGEIGMAMLNTMCNPGSVNIPWYQAMQPNHPKFGFLVVRVANDKIEQINEWSFCKHAFTSVNVNGQCGSCQDPGTGALMGLNCSDTYGSGNNASRYWLGPPQEIDPWLGTWNPVGSYFDIGDPNQPGFPAPADGVRSLNSNIFDDVQNRVTVDEADLLTPNASYYYGLQLIHEGESLQNRGDNLAHRGLNPTWGGSTWSFPNNSEGQEHGSILTRWPGATVEFGHNGQDDGRFFVASKVTPLGNGQYHYEYAIHNVDNSRAGGELRLPIDAGATATNFTFGDIDDDASNDWTAQRVGNEIVFTSTATNALEWNTIYNFGFDADFPPGVSTCEIVEARPGAGAPSVIVQTEVPGGSTIASFSTFGQGCQVSQMITVGTCVSHNLAAGLLNNTTSTDEYVYRVGSTGTKTVLEFSVWAKSATGNPETVNATIWGAVAGLPAATPLATTQITIGATEGWYTATFPTPVTVNGIYYIGYDSTQQTVYLDDLQAGQINLAYSRPNGSSTWSFELVRPSWRVRCTDQPLFPVPSIDTDAMPLLGTTYNLLLENGIQNSLAVLVSGLSNTSAGSLSLPTPLPGAPGCTVYVSDDSLETVNVSATGTASSPITIPNSSNLVGLMAYHQWAVLDVNANALGVVTSNAAVATVGQ